MTLIRNTGLARQAIKTNVRPATKAEIATKTRNTIAEAISTGTQDQFYWLIKMQVPPRYWQGAADNGEDRIACWPEHQFPVIPLAQDLYCEYADLLTESFRYSNKGATFTPTLIEIDWLNIHTPGRWYIWGELEIDVTCPRCAQIHRINANAYAVRCDCLGYRVDPHPMGLMRVTRAYVDGVMWEMAL